MKGFLVFRLLRASWTLYSTYLLYGQLLKPPRRSNHNKREWRKIINKIFKVCLGHIKNLILKRSISTITSAHQDKTNLNVIEYNQSFSKEEMDEISKEIRNRK